MVCWWFYHPREITSKTLGEGNEPYLGTTEERTRCKMTLWNLTWCGNPLNHGTLSWMVTWTDIWTTLKVVKENLRPDTCWPNFAWRLTKMTKFDLDILKSLCKSMFDHWRKAANTDTNIGSNGDGSSLEVPRTTDLGTQTVPSSIGQWSQKIKLKCITKNWWLDDTNWLSLN